MDRQSPAAQLRRCSELEYLLLGDLREMLEDPISTQARTWILAVLDALLDTLPREQWLKSQAGYLAEVLHEFPNWAGRVERLESQQYDLYDRLSDLRDALESLPFDPAAGAQLRYSLREWMDALTNHRHRESELLHSAVNTDIGGG